jgi:SGNH hydrolase-like domain, acetyltransferase AlgX
MSERPAKRGLFAATALAVSVLATLAVAELALQIADYPPIVYSPWIRAHDTGYQYAPSLHSRMVRPGEYDIALDTNALGLRDDEVGPKHGVRILLLGDSFAGGYGVERGEMFADILEHRLGVDIVDAGVGGYEIIHQVRYFDSRGRKLDADLVVYVLYLGNDLARNGEWHAAADGALVSSERTFPVRRPYEIKLRWLYQQARYTQKMKAEQARGEWQPKDDYLAVAERTLSEEGRTDYRQVEELLGQLRDEVRSTGADFFVVMVPYRQMVERAACERLAAAVAGFDERYDLDLPARRTGEILDRLGVGHFDLSPALRAHFDAGGEPLYFPVDGHLNVRGNALVADVLDPVVRALLGRIGASGEASHPSAAPGAR